MTHILPGATIGILGGGQLARMLALAGARLGLKTHIYSPVADDPAFDVCAAQTRAEFLDEAALRAFAQSVDVITYEFENVPARTADVLEELRPVRPNPKILALTQDRLVEKQFIRSIGATTADFFDVKDLPSFTKAVETLGYPSILKTRRFGYDGKGQSKVTQHADLSKIFKDLGTTCCILEKFVPFSKEVSVIATRSIDGAFSAYDLCENLHENHILKTTHVPARIKKETAQKAFQIAEDIANATNYVGVFAVEMFIVSKQQEEIVIVNEIAPRVHNSGHWTLDGATTSQFEQHMRAVAGWPLGSTLRLGSNITMNNLIGSEADDWLKIMEEKGAMLHLYGKKETRPGRKMGHYTKIAP